MIRSAVHSFETHLQATIDARLTDLSKATIDRLLMAEVPETEEPAADGADTVVSFTSLKGTVALSKFRQINFNEINPL